MYEAVEVFVNIFQAFAITFYLIKCLGVKEGKNRKCAYITGVIVTVLYLEIMNRIIFFESVGVLIYLVVSLAFSAVFLCGNVAQKIMYNVVMMVAIVCAAMLGAGIVGVIKGTDFLKVGQYGESSRFRRFSKSFMIKAIFTKDFMRVCIVRLANLSLHHPSWWMANVRTVAESASRQKKKLISLN